MFNGTTYNSRISTFIQKIALVDHGEVKPNDKKQKEGMKADKKKCVKELNIQNNDRVLCRQKKTTKSMSQYALRPYTVTEVKGGQVTATNDHHTITRHVGNCTTDSSNAATDTVESDTTIPYEESPEEAESSDTDNMEYIIPHRKYLLRNPRPPSHLRNYEAATWTICKC